ncbi:LysR family transcriptional regulator [Aquitalea magnusonii]|nr:LysR family transcriptional regulator [Aquitalea magnusonii]
MDRLIAMQVFVEVARRGSFTAASQELDLSRAMVSRYIAELEDWLGARLLQRSTRSVTLTDAGASCLARCQQMLELAAQTREEVGLRDGQLRGQLRITTSMSFGMAQLAPAISDFLAEHQQIRIDLQLGDQAVNLIEEGIDLAVRITNAPEPGLIARRLAECASVIVAAPDYLARHGQPQQPADLKEHHCLSYSGFGRSEWCLRRGQEEVLVKVDGRLSANEAMALLQACRHGAGLAMQPYYLVKPLLQSGELVALLPDWQPTSLGIYALYPSRRQLPLAMRTLLDFLQQHFAPTPPWEQPAAASSVY